MIYYRKVSCPSLSIAVTLNDQALALKLFTRLYDGGFEAEVTLADYFPANEEPTDDANFDALWANLPD